MMAEFLSHASLGRVVQSLITSTHASLRPVSSRSVVEKRVWQDDFSLAAGSSDALGCDSLDLLHLSAAVNEMFHLYEVGLEGDLLKSPSFGCWLNIIERAWQSGVRHLTVTTSGSSGSPKRCTHAFANLLVEVDFLAELFRHRSRIVAFTPAHHVYGLLFTAMLPDRLECPVEDLDAMRASGKEAMTRRIRSGDLIVSFPQGWEWLDRSMPVFPEDVEGVVSTAPCPPYLIESLVPGKLRTITEVYGSSETAGIGTRTWPAEAYTLMPQWNRKGEGDSASELLHHRADFEIDPMDHLRFVSGGSFLIDGRKDSGVQVGGHNVFPERIAERLKTHPEVGESSVRLMRPEEGNRLKCFVVPEAGCMTEGLAGRLEQWIESWPIAAERPKAVGLGAALPTGALGKACDWP